MTFVVGQRVRVVGMTSMTGKVVDHADVTMATHLGSLYLVRLDLQGDVDPGRSVPYFEDELEREPVEEST